MVLVTGGTGLLGTHVIYELLSKGHQVKALVRQFKHKDSILRTLKYYTPLAEELYSTLNWCEGDVTDLASLEDAFAHIDQVYHVAAFVSFNPRDKKKIYNVNVNGTANIVNLCLEHNVSKLCFVSSIAALGNSENGNPVDENVFWKSVKNESAYPHSKFKSEMEVWRGITEGLNAVIVNPSVIIGPGNWDKGSSKLFSTIENGMPFYAKGTTGFIDVRDVSRVMIQLMESNISGERFVLSTEDISYKDIFTWIANELGTKPPRWEASPFLGGIAWRFETLKNKIFGSEPSLTKSTVAISYKHLSYSSQKIKNLFGFEFIPIKSSVSDTIKLYKQDKFNKNWK